MPLDLTCIEGMRQRDLVFTTVLVLSYKGDLGPLSKLFDTNQVNKVGRLDLVVVFGVDESQRQETLLFAVGFMNTSK